MYHHHVVALLVGHRLVALLVGHHVGLDVLDRHHGDQDGLHRHVLLLGILDFGRNLLESFENQIR